MMRTTAPGDGATRASSTTTARRGQAFGLSKEDADDYYDVVMSSDDEDTASDGETDQTSPPATEPLDEAQRLVAEQPPPVSTASTKVLKHIGSISYAGAHDEMAPAKPRTVVAAKDDEFKLTTAQLESHTQRRSALEIALDAATRAALPTPSGDAPFRFATQPSASVQSPAPTFSTNATAGHAPQQSEHAKRKPGIPLAGVNELDSDDDDEAAMTNEPDPLYDDALDDADEKWVHANLRGGTGAGASASTDATLCCPCCFVTVCMDCQRHVKYPNQYRARVAMNCRVKKDEILTYASSNSQRQSAPGQQQWNSMTRRQASGRAGGVASAMLGADEYFGVVCSDCGTTVGVYDNRKTYHFFNILPSNC